MNILTGNNLESGAVVWWDGTGWSLYVDDAVDVGDRADEIIAREQSARRVNSAYVLDASRDEKASALPISKTVSARLAPLCGLT